MRMTVAGVVVVMMVMIVMMGEASREARQVASCSLREPCTPLKSCKSFQELLRRPDPATLRRIQDAICARDGRDVKVCCPGALGIVLPGDTTITPISGESLLPDRCGRPGSVSSPGKRRRRRRRRQLAPGGIKPFPGLAKPLPGKTDIHAVAGGVDVSLTQPYPWMALLGYNSRTTPVWACGGSLITAQYVITAAHCIDASFTLGLTLEVIRLGELNLGTERDCAGSGSRQVCAPPPQDLSPAEVIIHPTFNQRTRVSDDIALIRLDRKATLGPFVSPLCLPPAGQSALDLIGTQFVVVAGWGLNETAGLSAQILQTASLPHVDKAECNPIYNNSLVPEQICFGGGAQDSCQGDSGGPIFIRRNFAATLVGLVSRGLDFRCASKGIPAVYTDVTAYRPWIISNLKP